MKRFVVNDWIPVGTTRNRAFAGMTRKSNPGRMAGSWGFTLIEIIITIVMAGILLPAIVVPFVTGVKGSGKPEMAAAAMYLAHQKMEEFMKFNYSSVPLTALTLYADVDPGNFPNYQWQREILYVPSNDLMVSPPGSPFDTGYKRILIRIRDPENDTYEGYAVVTNFP